MGKIKCKLPNTHNRLNEVHYLLHKMSENYFNPEEFRIYLNATIQAMRNLTFALQNEKSSFEISFDEWYTVWQNEMKSDKFMKWLNDSRVQIVHRGDLESKSILTVRAFAYDDICVETHEVPINLTTEEVLRFLLENGYINPISSFNGVVFEVERKWIDKNLVDQELIFVLTHCFEFLYKLVDDAHKVNGININECDSFDKIHEYNFDNGKLSCLESSNQSRILKFSALDGSTRKMKTKTFKVDESKIDKILEHYNFNEDSFKQKKDSSVNSFFELMNTTAKKVISTDKFHYPMAFIFDENNKPILVQLQFNDKSEKYLAMDTIAQKVRELNSKKLIFIVDSWVSDDIASYLKYGSLENASNRKECLTVSLIARDCEDRHIHNIYERYKNEKIKFIDEYETHKVMNYFSPIYKVWKN